MGVSELVEVKLHDVGEGITEGEVVAYLVEEGERVSADEPLVEVQTDKMIAELPSPVAGTVKEIVKGVGETVQEGTTLLYIEREEKREDTRGESYIRQATSATTISTRSKQTTSPIDTIHRVLAAPYTRKLARDYKINIEKVQGTGPSGRVTEDDVHHYVKQTRLKNDEQTEKMVIENEAVNQQENMNREDARPDDHRPFRGVRKQIAKNMVKSLFTIPHVTHFDDIDLTDVMKLRKQLKKDGMSITVPAFLLKALVIALKDFPIFNAELAEENEQIILKKHYHIGLATHTTAGLMVPVVHHVDQKSIVQLHDDVKRLTKKAQDGKLEYSDMQHSTFTVSNVGPLGSTGATPIINHPETALIAFHQTKKMPDVNDQEEFVVGQMMPLSMSFDHRVVDGATAVMFTNRLKGLLENPGVMMIQLI